MEEKFYTILTNMGKEKIANSSVMGSKVNFAKIKAGDGNGKYYEPTEDQTKLANIVWEGNIRNIEVSKESPNWIEIEAIIPSDEGGFTIREFGVFDEEDNLLAISKCAETYKPIISDGSVKELLIKMVLSVSNTENVSLKVDPTIVVAKKSEVEKIGVSVDEVRSQMKDIANKVDNIKIADGTTAQKGIVQLNNTTNSTSITQAATANAVNLAMDRANSAFQSASDGKNAIAGKVGNVTGSNTHTEIANRIQTDKNTAASNLNSKGVSANGNEALASLVGKIANITVAGMGGKRFTSGNTKFDGTTDIRFQSVNKDFQPESGYSNTYYVTITLNFNPSYGLVYAKTSSSSGFNVSTLVNSNAVWTGNGLLTPIISGNTIKIPFSDKYVTSNVTYIFFE